MPIGKKKKAEEEKDERLSKEDKLVLESKPVVSEPKDHSPEAQEANLKMLAMRFVEECEANAPKVAPELRKQLKKYLA